MTPNDTLRAALAVWEDKRQKLQSATAALNRARSTGTHAQAEVERLAVAELTGQMIKQVLEVVNGRDWTQSPYRIAWQDGGWRSVLTQVRVDVEYLLERLGAFFGGERTGD
jgi:hypothetical protein